LKISALAIFRSSKKGEAMSISQEQFSKISTIAFNEEHEERSKLSVMHLKLISKKISQLVAKSWLPEGEEIKSVLLSNDSEKIQEMLQRNGIDIDILGDTTKFEVDWSTFIGSLEDSLDPNYIFRMVIGYPPKPSEYNLSDSDLVEWVNNTDDEQTKPTHPYIPVTW
jgi:hypothetical protein